MNKKPFRILLRKIIISSFFVVAFFLTSSVGLWPRTTQTLAANSLTFSSLIAAYKSYVIQPVQPVIVNTTLPTPNQSAPVYTTGQAPPKVITVTKIVRGPAGPAGPQGPAGLQGLQGIKGDSGPISIQSSGFTPLPSVFLPGAFIPPNPATNYAGGSIFSATDLSSNNFTTNNANITSLSVSGSSALKGSLNITGDSTFAGNSNFGGILTLGNTFSQTGANTFSTGTGAISLNGATSITGVNTLTVGTGLTTLGGDLTVSGTTTLNGLVITNSTLTSNAQSTFTKVPTLAHMFTTWPAGTSNASDGTIYINPASSVADGNLISAAVGGASKFVVDAEGDVYANNLILSGSTSTGATTIAGNLTVQDNTTLGDAPTDTVNFIGKINSNLTFTTDNTNDFGASGVNRPRTGYFGTSLFSPLIIGGTAVGSGITYKSTTGAGTAAGIAHQFIGGTDGATVAMTILNGGNVGIGTTNPGGRLDIAPTITATADLKGTLSGLVYNGATPMTNYYGHYIAAPTGTGTITNKYALVTEANAGKVRFGMTELAAYQTVGIKGDSTQQTSSLFVESPATGDTNHIFMEFDKTLGGRVAADIGLGFLSPGSVKFSTYIGGSYTEVAAFTTGTGRADFYSPNVLTDSAGNLTVRTTDSQAINKGGQVSLGGYATGASIGFFGSIAGRKENGTNANYAGYLAFGTSNSGSNNIERMRIDSTGNVGIGTTDPSAQKLVVAGNVRVGTGTTGCVEDADGTLLAGTCSSDERLKKNITPFSPVLDRLTQLTPVTYNWRADEFPDRHLGTSLQTGLIAQEVEKQFPELVMTDDKGFKQIVFQYLPFYEIQAIKELNLKVNNLEANSLNIGTGGLSSVIAGYASDFWNTVIIKVENGVAYMRALVVDTLTIGSATKPTDVNIYDKNGQAGCLQVEDVNTGNVKVTPGTCESQNQNSSGGSSNTTSRSGDSAAGAGSTSGTGDTTPPVIILIGENNLTLTVGDSYSEQNATVTDNIDTSVAVIISGSVDTNTAGVYEIKYNASDTAGNNATEVTRTVNVVGKNNPPAETSSTQ